MIVVGIDPHKKTHTACALEAATGVRLGALTVAVDPEGFERLRAWARALGGEVCFALEDCRHVSGRLERFLLARGERVVRVAPRLMAGARRGSRRRGKSDPIDAEAVGRVALAQPGLPAASLDPRAREIDLLLAHREDLVAERTRAQQRLRWHLHELALEAEVPPRALSSERQLASLVRRLSRLAPTATVRIASELVSEIRARTRRIRELERELRLLVRAYAPALLALPGCGVLTAAKLIAEAQGAGRFASDAAFAMACGAAPLDASSGAQRRHRLNRGGNRQLNCALHRIAITQARAHEPARAYLARRLAEGKTKAEALRCLKRYLARAVWQLLRQLPPANEHDLQPIKLRTAPYVPCLT
jgi:transposase